MLFIIFRLYNSIPKLKENPFKKGQRLSYDGNTGHVDPDLAK